MKILLKLRTLILSAFLVAASRSNADTVVAPNNLANEEGVAAAQAFTGVYREQTIYSAADFIGKMPQGGLITIVWMGNSPRAWMPSFRRSKSVWGRQHLTH